MVSRAYHSANARSVRTGLRTNRVRTADARLAQRGPSNGERVGPLSAHPPGACPTLRARLRSACVGSPSTTAPVLPPCGHPRTARASAAALCQDRGSGIPRGRARTLRGRRGSRSWSCPRACHGEGWCTAHRPGKIRHAGGSGCWCRSRITSHRLQRNHQHVQQEEKPAVCGVWLRVLIAVIGVAFQPRQIAPQGASSRSV